MVYDGKQQRNNNDWSEEKHTEEINVIQNQKGIYKHQWCNPFFNEKLKGG